MKKVIFLMIAVLIASLVVIGGCTQPAEPGAPTTKTVTSTVTAGAGATATTTVTAPAKTVTKTAATTPKPEVLEWTFASNPSTSGIYVLYASVTAVINKNVPEVHVTMMEMGEPAERSYRMSVGECDVNLSSNAEDNYHLYNGTGLFEGKGNPNIRALWCKEATSIPMLVRADSDVYSVYDLDGVPFCAGSKGTSAEAMTTGALEAIGVHPDYFVGTYTDMADAIKDRIIVGGGKLSNRNVPDSLLVEIMATTPMRLLTWPEEAIEKIRKAHPAWLLVELKPGLYGNEEPSNSWGMNFYASCLNSLPEDLVYKIMKAVCEDVANPNGIICTAYPGAKGQNWWKESLNPSTPLHIGAYRYLLDAGYQVPPEAIPPEAK